MKRNTPCKFVELLHPPCNATGWQFLELLYQPLSQKQVNMQATESSCSGFDVTSGPQHIPVKLGREPKWWRLDIF